MMNQAIIHDLHTTKISKWWRLMIDAAMQPGVTQGALYVVVILLVAIALYVGYAAVERVVTTLIESITDDR